LNVGDVEMKMSDIEMLPMYPPYINGVQAILDFGEYHLSIVKHEHSYGGPQGKYEIGVFEAKDGLASGMVELPGITQPGDTIKGFLADYEVDAILLKMTAITGKEPTQV